MAWYDRVVDDIKKSPAAKNRIVILGSTGHTNGMSSPGDGALMANRSHAYVGEMIQYFGRHGLEASFREGQIPDDDFVYLASASWIVAGGGGFSTLAQQIAEARGATVWRSRFNGDSKQVWGCFEGHHMRNLNRGARGNRKQFISSGIESISEAYSLLECET